MSQLVVQGAADATPAFRFERSNVARLAVAQVMADANSTIIYACALPAGVIAQRYGRRATFMIGTGCGVLSGLIGSWAVLSASFLFCGATFLGGVHAAVVLSFRFAADDCAETERRPRVLSAVMAARRR